MNPSHALASLLCCLAPVITVGYAATCAAWPFRACRRCHGAGKLRAPIGRYYRPCRRCDGTGLRIRYAVHVFNELRRIHRDGTR